MMMTMMPVDWGRGGRGEEMGGRERKTCKILGLSSITCVIGNTTYYQGGGGGVRQASKVM